jgi:hypothetical protein
MGRMPGCQDLLSTPRRSASRPRRTWAMARDSVVEKYGEGERALRVACGALQDLHEKVGDHEERKETRVAPSDPRSATPRDQSRRSGEGTDARAAKQYLSVPRRLGTDGRPRMSRAGLLEAIRKANRSRTREAQA